MNHIFYLHSNTCVIATFDIISKLLDDKENNVIIVLERGTKFPFFEGKVSLFDVQKVIDTYRKKTKSLLGTVINYKTSLHPQCKIFAEKVINNTDFVLYTPSYNMYSIKPFLYSKHCMGYYFIEEGFMAYLSEKTLRKHFNNRQYKKGHILMHLVGAGESFDYQVTSNFYGCIGLSEYSFPWCNDNKIITQFDGYFSHLPYEDIDVDYLITTDWLKDDIKILNNAFDNTIDTIEKNGSINRIAIKFHPSAFVNEKDKIEVLIDHLKSKYNIDFIILPPSYSIEALMYHRSISIYCIFGVSSLQLYAIMLKSKPYMVTKDKAIEVSEIKSIPEFLDISTKDWNS